MKLKDLREEARDTSPVEDSPDTESFEKDDSDKIGLDELRRKASEGIKAEGEKSCDFEGCENFASERDTEGHWCFVHRVKSIRESIIRGTSSGAAVGGSGFFAATCVMTVAVSPSFSVFGGGGPSRSGRKA